jgi:hypothetical protein
MDKDQPGSRRGSGYIIKKFLIPYKLDIKQFFTRIGKIFLNIPNKG